MSEEAKKKKKDEKRMMKLLLANKPPPLLLLPPQLPLLPAVDPFAVWRLFGMGENGDGRRPASPQEKWRKMKKN
jgi:hypothetical protein